MSTETIDLSTGEVIDAPAPTGNRTALALRQLTTPAALQEQQQLAALYDEACRALIGPNDVQVEGKRTFKKKSAWLKLARRFLIDARVLLTELRETPDGTAYSYCVAEARAPWGQVMQAVGACSADEEIGNRVITLADMLATAQTRATNRAISNLIAMGEVTADEVTTRATPKEATPNAAPDDGFVVPPCPTCGGPMYDNRTSKKNAAAPDFRCKDKACRDDKGYTTGLWLSDLTEPAAPAPALDPVAQLAVDRAIVVKGRTLGVRTAVELDRIITIATEDNAVKWADLIAAASRVLDDLMTRQPISGPAESEPLDDSADDWAAPY
jgi:hypothetical protein